MALEEASTTFIPFLPFSSFWCSALRLSFADMKRTTLTTGRPMEERLAVPGLRVRRVRAGLTISELCLLIRKCKRVDTSTMQAWEVDRSRPPGDAVECLARALGCTESDLYGGKKR